MTKGFGKSSWENLAGILRLLAHSKKWVLMGAPKSRRSLRIVHSMFGAKWRRELVFASSST